MIRRFARPWAQAIRDAAGSPQKANLTRGDLLRFAAALRESAELTELYSNPGVAEEAKLAITGKIARRLEMSELSTRTLETLVRYHRVGDLDAIIAALAAFVNKELGVAVAEVRSAKPLSPDEIEELAETLSRRVGKRVELDIRTDSALLGGFIVKIGSEIWDASVAGKINKFRESLAQ